MKNHFLICGFLSRISLKFKVRITSPHFTNQYLFSEIINLNRQIYQLHHPAYLMHHLYPHPTHARNSDDYLVVLQSNLSLKAIDHPHHQSSRQNDYDILFAEGSQDPEFNQLFNNSFQPNQNFSEIGEEDFQDDSLFNVKEGGCFHDGFLRENIIDESSLFQAPRKQFISYKDMQECQNEQKFTSMDRRTKILEILRMKGRQNKSKQSQRQSVSQTKSSSKSLVLKPKLQSQRSRNSESHSALKFAKRILEEGPGICNRVKTQSNQPSNTFNCQANQICRTDYDDLNDQRNTYGMIAQEKDSLECTFKPTILKQCLMSINQQKRLKIPSKKSHQKTTKPQSQKTSNSHSLKAKNNEKQQALPNKLGLNKKSSIYASGSNLDVVTRNQLWLIQKQQKLTQKRKEEEEQKLKQQDFSFRPSINLYKKDQKAAVPKANDRGLIPPFFQRLSMVKRKNTGIKFKKDEHQNQMPRNNENGLKEKNKQNILSIVNNDKDSSQVIKIKKQRYEEAVKELHHKIMKMNL